MERNKNFYHDLFAFPCPKPLISPVWTFARVRDLPVLPFHRSTAPVVTVPMLEKKIESALVSAVKKIGGLAPKFISPGLDGMPDRLLMLPGGHMAFVEVKAPGKRPRRLQVFRHQQLTDLGFKVFVVDSMEGVGALMEVLYGSDGTSRRRDHPAGYP